jgi:L-fucose isomerase-like protein
MTRDQIVIFGQIPQASFDRWGISSDLTLIEQKLDVHFIEIHSETLLKRLQHPTPNDQKIIQQVTQQLITKADPNPQNASLTEATMTSAVKLYVAMNHFVDKHQASAVTVVCRPWIQNKETTTPCIALMLFQEAGVPAACQGDLGALLTMMLFKRVAGVMSVMGNNFDVDGQLGIGHCVLSRQFCAPAGTCNSYYISDYHGRQPSPTVHSLLQTDQVVTMARLSQNLEQLILISGRLMDNRDLPGRCRNTLVIQVTDTNHVLDMMKGVQQHLVVACGDHQQALTDYVHARGITVVTGEPE